MFYRQLAEVSTYVTDNKYQINELLRLLCLRALSGLQVEGLVFAEIDALGSASPNNYFGFQITDRSGNQPTFAISDKTPFTDCIRENRIIWIDSLPSWPKIYSAMSSIALPKHYKTMISCPVESHGLPVGSLTILSRSKLEYDESIAQFIEAISMILSGALARNNIQGSSNHHVANKSGNIVRSDDYELALSDFREPLTERQNLILKMISEGRTNAAIADVLGYSESLIRQETIRIYAKLGCSGRNEAAQIFLRNQTPELAVKNSA